MQGVFYAVSSFTAALFTGAANPQSLNDDFLRASELLSSHETRRRIKGIDMLARSHDENALPAAQNAFQAYESGQESFAAQKALVALCKTSPGKAAEVASRVVDIVSSRSERGVLELDTPEFSQICKTLKELLSCQHIDSQGWALIDRSLRSWYLRDSSYLPSMRAEFTLTYPTSLQSFLGVSDPVVRAYARRLNSLAMLVALVDGIDSPGADYIRCNLVQQLRPDGFGVMVLKLVAAHASKPQLHEALVTLAKKWGHEAIERGDVFNRPRELLNKMLTVKVR